MTDKHFTGKAMGIRQDFLEQAIFTDQPANWFIHSEGFFHAGLKLIEAHDKLHPRKPVIRSDEIFKRKYTLKISIYLLCHAIELLMKGIISNYNKSNPNSTLKPPSTYSHHVSKMANALIEKQAIDLNSDELETLNLAEEYLQWFGRYYCPHTKDIPNIVEKSYTTPDENGLIEFKYKIEHPTTQNRLIKLYQDRQPSLDPAQFGFLYELHTP